MAWTQTKTGQWAYSRTATADELAYHEGGHAVLQHENGYTVISIYINPGATSNAGATQTGSTATPAPPSIQTYADLQSFFVKLGASFVAGAVAEYIDAGGGKPVPAFPSTLQYGDCQQAHAVFQQLSSMGASWNTHHQTAFTTSFASFLSEACDHAFDVLTRRRVDLDAVANALRAKKQLGATDCAALLP
ncbi:MAG: hypothetical protein L6Q31_02900 [Fimbriimonadaceae bacterium]|nr:hypothetical protein [Fimbriimonadaceae bacterium]